MCIKAIEKFKGSFSEDFIRKHIPSNFKIKYRQKNARIGFMKRLQLLENEIHQNLYQTKVYEGK